ncbi:unnamed protein product [Rotaria magnacalcarata]|uniref:Uncharacterized protein n=1 Tax=Rotaria magnacalcarata TaxID=392030 RepID=A0A816ZVD4_9BILA|nr:unnamed protein product [Rotaria magnacalcarata]CAF1639477.1 unnamed protein product [Rotaria magnacalcarata]CAF2215502.1 unnamed protein product [Rotaria magnacalcarata]CAF3765731.1 unnamed protein product [Rotaria magnacalcarata]CAF3793479.1 unnamed protein product [Rotaria magnacalcarata]
MWSKPGGMCHMLGKYHSEFINHTSREDYCKYLVKCALSKGFERHCPCSYNCSELIQGHCPSDRIAYPAQPLIRPYVTSIYYRNRDWSKNDNDKLPDEYHLSGSIKCRGYQANLPADNPIIIYKDAEFNSIVWETLFCDVANQDASPFAVQYDHDCWSSIGRTFTGRLYHFYNVFPPTVRCISAYRILDGEQDSLFSIDEQSKILGELRGKTPCQSQKRFRLRCSDELFTCLQVRKLGDGRSDCPNGMDESIVIDEMTNENLFISSILCDKPTDSSCQLIRKHLIDSWTYNSDSHASTYITEESERGSQGWHIPFRSYCNTFWNTRSQMDENSIYCQQWECAENEYQCLSGHCISSEWVCDGRWDCPDASDEQALFAITGQLSPHNQHVIGDLEQLKKKCYDKYKYGPFSNICNITREFPCLLANVSDPLNIVRNRPCINLKQIGDGVMDCFNNLDERNMIAGCRQKQKEFDIYCETNGQCIPQVLMCNRRCQNPKDDGPICSLIGKSGTSCPGQFDAVCLNGSCIIEGRCNGIIECPNGEDEYWWHSRANSLLDLSSGNRNKPQTTKHIEILRFLPNFPVKQALPSSLLQSFLSKNMPSIDLRDLTEYELIEFAFMCNKGVRFLDTLENKYACFCPPSFYGPNCEYMSDRVTVFTHIDLDNYVNSSINTVAIKLLIKFMFNNNLLLDHREVHVFPSFEEKNFYTKHKIHLLYPRSGGFLKHKRERRLQRAAIIYEHPYSIHFEAYELSTNFSINPIGVWHYPIYFDFLPAFRLAKILRFPMNWNDPCSSNPCPLNTTKCQRILNSNTSYMCSCLSGFYGENCDQYDKQCSTFCSPNAICKAIDRPIVSGAQHPFCICPLGYFGPRCYLRHNQCDSGICLNNGTCFPLLDPSLLNLFKCICTPQFYGKNCENEKTSVYIELNITQEDEIHALVVQYFDYDTTTLELIIKKQVLSEVVPASFTFSLGQELVPVFSLLKLYGSDYEPRFHLLYIKQNASTVNISSTVNKNTTFCPKSATFFVNRSKFILQKIFCDEETYEIVLKGMNLATPYVFLYHKICQQKNLSLHRPMFCFHDDDYLCICEQNFRRAECFGYNHSLDSCSHCVANGRCIKGDLLNPNDFICLCPRCHHGHLCQFSTELFSFTLNLLIVSHPLSVQIVYLTLIIILCLIGLFSNFCSVLTFIRSNTRKFGVGNYILILSIINQLCMLSLVLKIFHVILEPLSQWHDAIFCKTINYFLSVLTRSNYWLSSWIAIERVLIVLFPTVSRFRQPQIALGLSAFTLLVILGFHTHELIYYTVTQSICMTNFEINPAIAQYNRISVLIHYLLPFCIQIISITILVGSAARSRAKLGRHPFIQLLKKQFKKQKELYITPIVIVLSLLPHAVLSFSFACTRLSQSWEKHTLLIAYLLSYTPQILGFILLVMPSSVYKKEFQQTWLGKTQYMKWILKSHTDSSMYQTKMTLN